LFNIAAELKGVNTGQEAAPADMSPR